MTLTVTVGPRNAYTDPESGLRFYRWQGRDLPSVTSIRRMAGVPHSLHQWVLNQVIRHALENWQPLTERLATGDPGQIQLIKAELRAASTAERDKAGALGTAVHDAAAAGKRLTEVPPEVAPRLGQYLDWLAASGAEILGAEFQVFNLTLGYAGTVDLLVRFPNGSVWLIDLKTGKTVVADYVTQLVGYRFAEFVGADDVVDEPLTALLREISGVAILHLADDHWEFIRTPDDPDTWAAFEGLLRFAVWTHNHQKPETFTIAAKRSAA